MKAEPTAPLRATAYHEAGHAVARWWLRLALHRATIIPDTAGDTLGHVAYSYAPAWRPDVDADRRTRDRAEREIMASVAGPLAEAAHLGRELENLDADTWQSDRHRAIDLALYVTGSPDEAEAFTEWLTVRARNLITGPLLWPAVGAVAGELLSHRTLTGRQVSAIARDARPPARKAAP